MSDNFDRKVCNEFGWIAVSSQIFTDSPLYEEFLGVMCHSLLYFAILTYIN